MNAALNMSILHLLRALIKFEQKLIGSWRIPNRYAKRATTSGGSFCHRCKNAVVETVSHLALNAELHSFYLMKSLCLCMRL